MGKQKHVIVKSVLMVLLTGILWFAVIGTFFNEEIKTSVFLKSGHFHELDPMFSGIKKRELLNMHDAVLAYTHVFSEILKNKNMELYVIGNAMAIRNSKLKMIEYIEWIEPDVQNWIVHENKMDREQPIGDIINEKNRVYLN